MIKQFAYIQSITSISLVIATCSMRKNTRLPVPYENFSLTDGCFGNDPGFTIQKKTEENFLDKLKH